MAIKKTLSKVTSWALTLALLIGLFPAFQITVNASGNIFDLNVYSNSAQLDTALRQAVEALNNYGGSSALTVTGSHITSQTIDLGTIKGGVTVTWNANLSGHLSQPVLSARGAGTIEMTNGSVINTGTGHAVSLFEQAPPETGFYHFPFNFILHRGTVAAREGYAFYSNIDSPKHSVWIEGGFVFAYGGAISDGAVSQRVINFETMYPDSLRINRNHAHNAVISWWNTTDGIGTHNEGSYESLSANSRSDVYWSIQSGIPGISYANGGNTGFFPITPGLTLNPYVAHGYINAGGVKQNTTRYVGSVDSSTSQLYSGWHIVTGDVVRTGTLTTNGDVHLILADNSHLNVTEGIRVTHGGSLTIYAQSMGASMGKLTAAGSTEGIHGAAGIGNDYTTNTGDITINGGFITAAGGNRAAGIGGGHARSSGNIVINGGVVTAAGGIDSAGIGNGSGVFGGTFSMNGNAVVFASSVSDTNTANKTGGMLFNGVNGTLYSSLTLVNDITIPDGYTLTVPSGRTLTIPSGITITNNGTVIPADGSAVNVTGTVTGKINGANVSALTISNTDSNSVTLNTVNLRASTGQTGVEYAVSDSAIPPVNGWQDGTVFTGLTPNATAYFFFARSKENVNFKAGTPSTVIHISAGSHHYLYPNDSEWLTGIKNAGQITEVNDNSLSTLTNGWYIFDGNWTRTGGLTVDGDVHVILKDNCNVTVTNGLRVPEGNSLTVYGQSDDAARGRLTANGTDQNFAGIGSNGEWHASGTITVNGGVIVATGGQLSAGIGSGSRGGAGNIIINGGKVTATGGRGGAAVGSGSYATGGHITITGGDVSASGGAMAAGIGGGTYGEGGTINIKGGTVTAAGGSDGTLSPGAGIGGGAQRGGGTVTISGGTVTVTTNRMNNHTGTIGHGWNGSGGTLILNGNAVIYTLGVTDTGTGNKTGGILFIENNGTVYGSTQLAQNLTIGSSQVLTVPTNAALTVPRDVTLQNNGAVVPADGSAVNINGTVTGNKINGANTAIPTDNQADRTYNSVTLNPSVLLAATGQTIEYAVNTFNAVPANGWQENLNFTGLTPEIAYYFFARSKENGQFRAGTAHSVNIALDYPAVAADITSVNNTTMINGVGGVFQVTANGSAPITFSLSGQPAGVSIDSGTGLITVDASTVPNTYTFAVTASNGAKDGDSTQNFTLSFVTPPRITSANHVTVTNGTGGNFQVTAEGTAPITYGLSGAVPVGVSINSSTGEMTIAGTTDVGVYLFSVTANNGSNLADQQVFTLDVRVMPVAPAITSVNNVTAALGATETFQVTADGTLPINYGLSGTVPAGVGINASTGLITIDGGNPGIVENTPYMFTVTASNGTSPDDTQNITLTVSRAGASFDIGSVKNGTVGTGWKDIGGVITVENGADITVTGTATDGRRIVVDGNATITLNNIYISSGLSPLLLNNGAAVEMVLTDNNTLIAGDYQNAGIQAPSGTTLTIGGTGSLTANGAERGAGIGGSLNQVGGNITINSGTITANGGMRGAGIGGGGGAWGGLTIINGGTVKATGGGYAAGIGGASISGGIAGGGGTVQITGGTVTAQGGLEGAGIGGGSFGDGGSITIGGNAVVDSKGGTNGSGIGGGVRGSGGTVTIAGNAVVNLRGSNGAAGIGGGNLGGNGGTVAVNGGTVSIIAINGGAGIGSGDSGSSGGTLSMNGSGVVYAPSVSDTSTVNKTRGILFIGNDGTVYGNFEFAGDMIIAGNQILTVPIGARLIVAVTLTNNGTIIPANGSAVSVLGTITGNKINGANVGTLASSAVTHNSVTLKTPSLSAVTWQDVEYAVSMASDVPSAGWQDSAVFTELAPETDYYFFARSKSDVNFNAGAASGVMVTTESAPPDITSENNMTLMNGVGGTFQVAANGSGTITYALSGTVPVGVSMDPSTGLITIAADTAVGTHTFTITAASSFLPNATQVFTLIVEPLVPATFNLTTGTGTGTGWTWNGTILTVNNGTDIHISGTVSNGRRIVVDGTANITLDNVSITGLGSIQTPLLLNNDANLSLTLIGTNTLSAGSSSAGIQARNGTTLTITAQSTGSLSATGGNDGAGIGGRNNSAGGTIIINGGSVTATGGGLGAGIGGGSEASGGSVTINGGTVTAIGGVTTLGTTGGSGIGSAGGGASTGGTVTINGGTVTATGNGRGAGIGTVNNSGSGGTITITGGTVTATGGSVDGAGIGGGNNANGLNITITGGTVTANGSGTGIGIGGATTSASGRFTLDGDGVVFASSVMPTGTNLNRLQGILFIGENGSVYGYVTLADDVTIDSGNTLTVLHGTTLDAQGVILTNNGKIINNGTVIGFAICGVCHTDPCECVVSDMVDIDNSMSVAEIQAAITAALAVHDTVTVKGSKTNVENPLNNYTSTLMLDINSTKTLKWEAEYSGENGDYSMISLSGTGIFEISGSIVNYGNSDTLATSGATNFVIDDGTVVSMSSDANIRAVTGISSSTILNGGLVFSYGTQISDVLNSALTHNGGTVAAWNKAAGNTVYDAGTNDDLFSGPANSVEWGVQGGKSGIVYSGGFFEVPDVTVVSWDGIVRTFSELQAELAKFHNGNADMIITVGADFALTENLTVNKPGYSLTIKSDTVTRTLTRGFQDTTNSSGLFIIRGGGLVFERIIIDGNKNVYSGNIASLVYIFGTGMFTMKDGAVLRNNRASTGGGVNINTTDSIPPKQRIVFEMQGGSINGNISTGHGGGVYITGNGEFFMSGGTISGNEASTGGGVRVYAPNNKFTMTGGEISGNIALSNIGGGVYVNGNTTTLGGTAVIKNNKGTGDVSNNTFLLDNKFITLGTSGSVPTSSMEVWVNKSADNGVIINTAANAGHEAYFKSDVDGKVVVHDNGQLILREILTGMVSITLNPANGTLTAETTGVTNGSGAFTYTWSGAGVTDSNAATLTAANFGLGETVTLSLTRADTSGSLTAAITVYQVTVTPSGNTGSDSVSISNPYGRAGDTISIAYTLGNVGALNNTLTFGGVAVNPAQITATGNGSTGYTITAADAASGVIALTAIFTHNSNLEANIGIGSNNWNIFWNTISFGLFFKNTQTVTVFASGGAGAIAVEYHLSATEYIVGTDVPSWTAYPSGGISLAPRNKHIIYIKLTDTDNNTTYFRSDGIVVYLDSEDMVNAEFNATLSSDLDVPVTMNGNTVLNVTLNSNPTSIVNYIPGTNTIRFDNIYLKGLGDGIHSFTVHYDPMGVPYVDDSAGAGINESPGTTIINISIYTPAYGITLSESGTHTFTGQSVGYSPIAPFAVTVMNNSIQATGILNVALSGTGSGSFILSSGTLNSIAVSGNDSLTIKPNDGLPTGTYTAMVTVSGGNGISASFNVSFTVSPTLKYSVTLSETGTLDFLTHNTGYSPIPAHSVTVTNNGNQPTGNLTVTISGTDRGSFTLSANTINSIAVSGTDTFTIRPNNGLPSGSYTAVVTVTGSNGISASFNVVFKVAPTPAYDIILSEVGNHVFATVNAGYSPVAAYSVTVTNNGNQATGALTVALSGTNSGSFTLSRISIPNIAVSGTDTFTVKPNDALPVGSYTATVTISGGNGIKAYFNVSFTVNPAPMYGVILNETGTHTFTAQTVGYSPVTPFDVSVMNNGNQATGNLDVALSGTNGSSFTLSTNTFNSIAVSGNDNFTVKPNDGLPVGTYNAMVAVSGSNSISASLNVSFTVNAAPIASSITSENNTSAIYGVGGTFQVTATGDAPIIYSLSGQPAGVSIDSTTGIITIAGTTVVGTHNFTITANNGVNPNATQNFTLTVNPAPAPTVTSVAVHPSVVSVERGQAQQFNATVDGSNNPPQTVTWSVAGGEGSTSINNTGLLSVDIQTSSEAALTVMATSTLDPTKSGTAVVTVIDYPVTPDVLSVTVTPSMANVQKGESQQFNAVVAAQGGASDAVSWSVSGNSNRNTTVINGLLTVSADETAQGLIVTATSVFSRGKSDSATVTLTDPPPIPIPPSITTGALQSGTVGTAYNETLMATGDAAIIWSLDSGNLPDGLSLATNGVISGTPTTSGTFKFIVKAANGAGSDLKTLSITINVAPVTVTHTITATAGTGGSISPSGSVTVINGVDQIFYITPNSNYAISHVTVNGANVGADSSYTFNNVTANHTITAEFYYTGSGYTYVSPSSTTPPTNTVPPTTRPPATSAPPTATAPSTATASPEQTPKPYTVIAHGGNADATVEIPITVDDETGTVIIKLDSETKKALIADAFAHADEHVGIPTVTLDLSEVEIAVAAELTVEIAQVFAEVEVTVTVILPAAEITIPYESLAVLAAANVDGATPIIVEATLVPIRELTGMQAAQVRRYETVVNIDVIVGNKKINVPLTISLPYTLKINESPAAVRAWYLDDNGRLTNLNGVYDAETGMITFTVSHQSYFVVGYEPVALWVNVFSDVGANAWYYEAVAYANCYGLFSGYGGGIFAPQDSMTRAMFVAVLYNLEGGGTLRGTASFNDVLQSAWYYDAVMWAAENSIVNGVGDNRYAPDRAINRQEMVVMLMNYAAYKGYVIPENRELLNFTDFDAIAEWARNAAYVLTKAGVTNGDGVNFFPHDNATRAEVAAIFENFLRFVVDANDGAVASNAPLNRTAHSNTRKMKSPRRQAMRTIRIKSYNKKYIVKW